MEIKIYIDVSSLLPTDILHQDSGYLSIFEDYNNRFSLEDCRLYSKYNPYPERCISFLHY